MKIYDSLSESHRNLPSSSASTTSSSISNKGTAWYICGPTVYDSAHLGHGRTYVSMDILRRVALNLHNGNNGTNKSKVDGSRQITPRPLYVMNITDVDDKIIQRSIENSKNHNINNGNTNSSKEVDPLVLARHYENEFWSDMKLLNVMKPDVICRVSEHVTDTIVPYIQQIVDGGMAYVILEEEDGEGVNNEKEENKTQQGSVYFDVRAFESITNGRTKYGKLAPDVASTDFFTWEESSNEEEEGVKESSANNQEDDEGQLIQKKHDPRDFCLWKYRSRSSSSPTAIVEPSSVSYDSPWGPGRPGWHVECSAMIQQLSLDFNKTHKFQIHAGGVDLKFPHHSNEIAQSEAYIASCNSSCSSSNDDEDFKEWIPHWIHTGHLYVKGRKMSKSLKNFITIREMLGISSASTQSEGEDTSTTAVTNQIINVWSSPADDFRLWCLGLSGSYRGPATYSKDRMEEARVIREKWIRFLMEGQECLDRLQSIDDDNNVTDTTMISSSSRLWGDEELQLFHTVTQCSMTCRRALLDDLDGALFIKQLTSIADTGLAYVEQVKMNSHTNNRPEEPLRFVLDTLRGQLDLVGFTERTVNAGISTQDSDNSQQSTNSTMVDETVAFRASVRSAALSVLRKKTDGVDSAKDILGLCDKLRDDTFPKLGIEILDVVEKNDDDSYSNRGWRHCSPTE